MKIFIFFICVMVLSGCATPEPIPPDIRAAVEKTPIDDLPVYSSIEQQRCPKARYPSFDKRRECKYEVRRKLAALELMREQEPKSEF